VALADAGLGADALGHSPGVREQRVEQRARGPLGTGSLVSQLDLAGYLALADEHAVETGGDAEQVPDGVQVVVCVEVGADLVGRQAVEIRQEVRELLAGLLAFTGVAEVQFDAVAGAEQDRLPAGAGREPVEGPADLLVRESEPFANPNGGSAITATQDHYVHRARNLCSSHGSPRM
jgi:hypothetical protein